MEAYRDTSLSFAERAKELVAQMTTAEKIDQLLSAAPALERLGIPAMDWWSEALHGVAREGTATMFPQAIGMAATFDPALIGQVGEAVGVETRIKHEQYAAHGVHDLYKGLSLYSPNVNIFRDPRWGRGQETYGEDPWLAGRLGVAYIRGLQGSDPDYRMTAACAKHFAVHSGPEADRHTFNAVVSPKDLRETYLPAFEACVKEGHVAQVMGAYNRAQDELCCASDLLLGQILRGEWDFDGMVVSDFGAIADFHSNHKLTKDAAESAALAIRKGCDMNLGFVYAHAQEALDRGILTEADIDRACTRVMEQRLRLGLYETPAALVVDHDRLDSPAHRALNLQTARESLVLLKNDGMLPLRGIRSLAVIGPNAMSRKALMGNYHGDASEYITVLDGIRAAAGEAVRIRYSSGCELVPFQPPRMPGQTQTSDEAVVSHFGKVPATFNFLELMGHGSRTAEALAYAEESDAVVLVLGLDESVEGEEMRGGGCDEFANGDKKTLLLPSNQRKLLDDVLALGKPTTVVLLSGSALAVDDPRINALVQAWYPGALGGRAVGELLFGAYSPSGRLPVTFYRDVDDLPAFTDYAMANRTYRYYQGDPLYPFGFGLSYTRFDYSGLSIEAGSGVTAQVTVTNSGSMAGREVVQAYVRWEGSDASQPRWHLCALDSVELAPGASAVVTLVIPPEALYTYHTDGSRAVEPGRYRLWVGGGQPDARTEALTGQSVLEGAFTL